MLGRGVRCQATGVTAFDTCASPFFLFVIFSLFPNFFVRWQLQPCAAAGTAQLPPVLLLKMHTSTSPSTSTRTATRPLRQRPVE
eukprot:m.24637 g.24637  ORF g.24637 m.24637 type:complete len:84 (-) comp8729_c0_seq1:850-1101(-)